MQKNTNSPTKTNIDTSKLAVAKKKSRNNPTTNFLQLWAGVAENANVFPPLALFSFVIFLPISWDGEKNRCVWHILLLQILILLGPLWICTFQFQLWTYNLSVWVNLHKYSRFILLFAFCPVTFSCYSNFKFVIFKYFKLNLIIGDFSSSLSWTWH